MHKNLNQNRLKDKDSNDSKSHSETKQDTLSGDWIWYIDKKKNLVFANQAFKKSSSFFSGKEPQYNKSILDQGLGNSIKNEWISYFDRALAGESFTIDMNSYIKDEYVSSAVSFHPIYDGNEITGVACHSRNPQEINKVKGSVSISEEKYRLLFKENPIPIAIYDFETFKIQKVNQAAIDKYGYTGEEILSMTILDFRLKEDYAHFLDWRAELNEQQKNKGFFRHTKKDGEIFLVQVTTQIIQYNNKKSCLSLIEDISEIEATKKQLVETYTSLTTSQNKFKTVFDSSLEGLVITDEAGYIQEVNPALCKLFAYKREELIGNHWDKFFEILKEELDEILNTRKELGMYVGLLNLKTVDGRKLSIEISTTSFKDQCGRILNFSSVRDISDKVAADLKLARSEQLYKSLFDQNPDAIFSMGLDGLFISVNEALAHLAECSKEELMKNSYTPLVPSENTELILTMFNKAVSGESVTEDLPLISTKGKKLIAQTTMMPIIGGEKIIGIFGIMKDITEFQNTKTKLKERENRFQTLIENSTDMLILIDGNGKIAYLSPSIERTLGYSEKENKQRISFDFVFENDQKYIREKLELVLKSPGKPILAKLRVKHKSGQILWIEGSITNMLEVPGINAIVSNFRDITEKRLVEKDLKISLREVQEGSDRQSAILDSLRAYIALLDSEGKIIEINNAWSNFDMGNYFISKNYIIGSNYIEVAENAPGENADIGKKIAQAIQDVSNGDLNEFNLEYSCKCSVDFQWFRVLITPLYKLKKGGVVITHFNISDRKLAELKIKQSNERYELVTKATSDAIWDWNLQTDELYWGDAYEKLFGYSVNLVKGGKATWSNRIHPDDKARVVDRIQKEINQNVNHFWQDEYRYIRADGSIAYVYDRGFVIFDEKKQPLRMVGAMQDITERKNAEMERDKMTNDLIQRNKDLEQFTYIVSHNLRAPLANIMGISNMINEYDLSHEEMKLSISDLDESVKKLDFVINDLNQILQIKHDQVKQKEYVEFEDIVENVKSTLSSIIVNEKASISTDFSEAGGMYVVRPYLYSIFNNLISNSIKYRQVNVPIEITIESKKIKDTISIIFRDNGMGMDLTRQEDKLFRLYSRFHPKIDGKGMGLYMVKTHVETIGGRINVSSQVNNGTEFIIQFELS